MKTLLLGVDISHEVVILINNLFHEYCGDRISCGDNTLSRFFLNWIELLLPLSC